MMIPVVDGFSIGCKGGNKFVLVLLPRGCGVSTSVASCAHYHCAININSRGVYFGVNLLKKWRDMNILIGLVAILNRDIEDTKTTHLDCLETHVR